ADEMRAVGLGLEGVEPAGIAGDALGDDLGVTVDEHCHVCFLLLRALARLPARPCFPACLYCLLACFPACLPTYLPTSPPLPRHQAHDLLRRLVETGRRLQVDRGLLEDRPALLDVRTLETDDEGHRQRHLLRRGDDALGDRVALH